MGLSPVVVGRPTAGAVGSTSPESTDSRGAVMTIGTALRRARIASIVNGNDANPTATTKLATPFVNGWSPTARSVAIERVIGS